jgi:hypothetical protein
MNSTRFTVAAILAVAAAAAVALGKTAHAETTVPIDGGGATGITLVDMSAAGTPRTRTDVAAEARAAWRHLNSRSGQQTDAEDHLHVQLASNRGRDEVRKEGIAYSRQAHPDVFEGGQSGTMMVQARTPARPAVATMAQTSD